MKHSCTRADLDMRTRMPRMHSWSACVCSALRMRVCTRGGTWITSVMSGGSSPAAFACARLWASSCLMASRRSCAAMRPMQSSSRMHANAEIASTSANGASVPRRSSVGRNARWRACDRWKSLRYRGASIAKMSSVPMAVYATTAHPPVSAVSPTPLSEIAIT
eukprot:5243196-Pleurochrysis_carterae.AAC.4